MSQVSQDIKTLLSTIKVDPNLVGHIKKNNDVIMVESGHYVYWPQATRGYLDEFNLLHVAAYLWQLNAEWDAKIEQDLNV